MPDPLEGARARWGALATVLWCLAVLAVFFAAQVGFVGVFVAATMAHLPPAALEREMAKLGASGDILAVATLLSTPACMLALFAIVKLKRGASLTDTLALHVPPRAIVGRWLAAAVALIVVLDAVTWLLGKPIVPEFMRAVYQSAESKPTLWFAFIVAAPLCEELLFRGFAITGLAASRIGAAGAVIVASLAWAAIHVQYDLYGIATIIALGLLFGAARIRTGTVLVPIAMHAVANLVATVETMLKAG